jgi:hypothetical protein
MAFASENDATGHGREEWGIDGKIIAAPKQVEGKFYSYTVRSAHPLRCDMEVRAKVNFAAFRPG